MAHIALWTLLLCLSALIDIGLSVNVTNVHYIVPALSSCPPGRQCTDIATLLNKSEEYFTSNTKVVFLPEIYVIDTTLNVSIVIYNVSDLVIAGSNQSKVIVQCHAHFNIIIIKGENVLISNIELLRCGGSVHHSNFFKKVKIEIYDHLRLSDKYRFPTTSAVAHYATIYILDSLEVSIENMTITNTIRRVTILTVNVYKHFNVTRCSIQGMYRIWYIDKYFKHPLNSGIFHKIQSSNFLSWLSENGKQTQEAIKIVVGQSRVINLVMQNTTIQGKTIAKEGYIMELTLSNVQLYSIKVIGLKTSQGRKQIIVQDGKQHSKTSTITLYNVQFEGSSLYFSRAMYSYQTRNPTIFIENLLITNPADSLKLMRATVFLNNVTISGGIKTAAINFISCLVYFEGYNKICSCKLDFMQDSKPVGILAIGSKDIATAGVYSYNSTITFRGEMFFCSNRGYQGGALAALAQSIVVFEGTTIFTDNTGYNGGAVAMHQKSQMIINHTASVTFQRNYAQKYGGAIYIEDEYKRTDIPQCFFEPVEWSKHNPINYRVLNFENNIAEQAGDIVYAADGQYSKCTPRSNQGKFPIEMFINIFESNSTNISVSTKTSLLLYRVLAKLFLCYRHNRELSWSRF